jgi:hypothetical protein
MSELDKLRAFYEKYEELNALKSSGLIVDFSDLAIDGDSITFKLMPIRVLTAINSWQSAAVGVHE